MDTLSFVWGIVPSWSDENAGIDELSPEDTLKVAFRVGFTLRERCVVGVRAVVYPTPNEHSADGRDKAQQRRSSPRHAFWIGYKAHGTWYIHFCGGDEVEAGCKRIELLSATAC